MISNSSSLRRALLLTSVAAAAVTSAVPAQAIVVRQPSTPATVVDRTVVTGIGQMIVPTGGGGVSLCTGTLINPRMVLFAAHCVNSRAATAYGSNEGGTPLGFGFDADNLPGTRSFVLAGPNQFKTNTSLFFYNAQQVYYNALSLRPESRTFLEADIAIAALDTPAGQIPTWTMLFSPLPSPSSISTSGGTGYHVTIAGYGSNGVGPTGDAGGIDFRRRVAENILGGLASLDDIDSFLFGEEPQGNASDLPQNLYFIDFDDPRRGAAPGQPQPTFRDFNLFRDNALAIEGTTAGGDSGGPLILDRAFARPVVIGALSGGQTFFGPPRSSYGTSSFYQPLFLFWDYIVANNPYRYVSSIAGNRNWTDPTNWITNLDPSYQILDSGNQLANGVPTNLGDGVRGTTPKFGELCFQFDTTNECVNLANGTPRNNVPNTTPGEVPAGTVKAFQDGSATEEARGDAPSKRDAGLVPGLFSNIGAGWVDAASNIAGAPGETTAKIEVRAVQSGGAPTLKAAASTPAAPAKRDAAVTPEVYSGVGSGRVDGSPGVSTASGAATAQVQAVEAQGSPASAQGVTASGNGKLAKRDAGLVQGLFSGIGTARIDGATDATTTSGAATAQIDASLPTGDAPEAVAATTGSGAATSQIDDIEEYESQAEGGKSPSAHIVQPLPAPTLANGLPGATNFVPNNTNGVRATGERARYFDVTLAAAGTTTLNTNVQIDRLTISGATAGLNIASTGSLMSLIDITQTAGRTNVNGTLRTRGDYALLGGLLSGTGTVQTPFLTSVMGTISPGSNATNDGIGTIGTLTIQGNVVLASGSRLLIDVGSGGASDRLVVVRSDTEGGLIQLGGSVVFSRVPGSVPRFNDQFTFLTSSGPRTGTFATPATLSAILFPVLTYGPNSVSARLDARSFTTVINANSPVQAAFAQLFDRNRVNYSLLSDLFGTFDLLTPAEIRDGFESLAPRTEITQLALGRMATEGMSRFYRERMSFVRAGEAGGTLALIGNPLQFAALQTSGMDAQAGVMNDAAQDGTTTAPGVTLPSTISAFVAGGFLQGRVRALPSLTGGRDKVDGWYVAGGLEMEAFGSGAIGAAVHYVDTDGDSQTQRAKGKLIQGTLYGTYQTPSGLEANGHVSAGIFKTRSNGDFTIGTTTRDDRDSDESFALTAEAAVGQRIGDEWLRLTPEAAIRYTRIDGGGTRTQNSGLAALTIEGDDYESTQGRLGFEITGFTQNGDSLSVRPRFAVHFVHEFMDQPSTINIGFAATPSITVPLALGGTDRNWAEASAGFRVGGERISVDFSADTTMYRRDARFRTYRAALNVKF